MTLLLPTQTHENPESKVTAASGNTLIQCDVYRYVYLLIFKNIYLPLHASISSLSHTLLSSNLLDLLPPSLPPSLSSALLYHSVLRWVTHGVSRGEIPVEDFPDGSFSRPGAVEIIW